MGNPRLGVFKFSCCSGCEFELVFFQKRILETLSAFDIAFWRMVTSGGELEGPFDLALIEGAITEAWQADELKKIRSKSKALYAIGTCAINGGIPAMKALRNELSVERDVYKDLSTIHSIRTHAAADYVDVDGIIRGCPPSDAVVEEALSSYLFGRKPDLAEYSVCVECKLSGNRCLLVEDKAPCLGPVTNAGCGAACPSNHRACFGCYGPMRQANAPALAMKFISLGVDPEDVRRRFSEFGATAGEFAKVVAKRED